MRVFTKGALEKYDGRDGTIYVAYGGKVYDVSKSFHWKRGVHWVVHRAGRDLTEDLKKSPHGSFMLEHFPIVGKLSDVE